MDMGSFHKNTNTRIFNLNSTYYETHIQTGHSNMQNQSHF